MLSPGTLGSLRAIFPEVKRNLLLPVPSHLLLTIQPLSTEVLSQVRPAQDYFDPPRT